MSQLIAFLLTVTLILQPGVTRLAGAGIADPFSPPERAQLRQEKKVDGRIKVYDAASQRLLKSVGARIKEENRDGLTAALSDWSRVLGEALEDVELSVQPGKKPKALIRFEIQLRKAISELEGLKMNSGVETFDLLGSWIAQAEEVRSRFVDILFQR